MRVKTTITVSSRLCAVLLAVFLAADASALGGPVIMGGEDADFAHSSAMDLSTLRNSTKKRTFPIGSTS